MKKKIFAIVLCVAMLAIAIVGSTMAYFTDADAETNTFVVGNVDIEIVESTLHRQNDNATDEDILADANNYQTYLATAGKNMVPGRWVRKAPYIHNTGKNAAYVRVIIEQSDWFHQNTSMMEYTEAQEQNKIVVSEPTQDMETGKWAHVYTFVEPLEPGELSYFCPILELKINESVTSDDAVGADAEEIITVYAEAIQAEGFDNHTAAFAAFDERNS